MFASCSNIANADRHIVRKLALDIDRILLHSWRLSILIDEADGCAHPGQGAQPAAGWLNDTIRKWVIQCDGWNECGLRDTHGVLSKAHLPVVAVGCIRNRIVVRRPKYAVTAA